MSRCLMNWIFLTAFWLSVIPASAQHCAPIVESYLQSVSIGRSRQGLDFEMEYRKTGGQPKAAYQAYLLAYKHSDAERIAALTPQEAIESRLATIVHSQLAERQPSGCYRVRWSLDTRSFVAVMLRESRIDRESIDDIGGWKSFKDRTRFAVFIPFLEDEKYSVIEGLPEEKHECNYLGEAALLFESLPQTFSIHFGIVQAVELPENEYYIQVNGHRPLK